jgi:hypothetical protein
MREVANDLNSLLDLYANFVKRKTLPFALCYARDSQLQFC